MHRINISVYNARKKFDKDHFAAEQNNYTTKILNAYIFYDLDTWPNNPLRNSTLKNCLFGATSAVKNSDKKSKCIVVIE